MDLSAPLRLRRGFVVVRRDDHSVQVGLDAPHRVVVADGHRERRLLAHLAAPGGCVADRQDERLLALLAGAGLLEAAAPAPRIAGVAVDAPAGLRRVAATLLAAAGVPMGEVGEDGQDGGGGEVVLVADDGEPERARVDPLVRAGRSHLVVSADGRRWTVGPFVVPGATACLRCVDAHRVADDPRRLVVAEQLARHPGARSHDTVLRDLALAWAVRDLRTYLTGGRPSTWSTSYVLGDGAPEEHAWRRHPHCGCAWDLL